MFRGLPKQVVANSKAGTVAIESARGQQGVLFYQLQQEIETLMNSWQLAHNQFTQLANYIELLDSNLLLARIQPSR